MDTPEGDQAHCQNEMASINITNGSSSVSSLDLSPSLRQSGSSIPPAQNKQNPTEFHDENPFRTIYQPTYSWTDISHDFQDACKELKLGQLVHDEMFGLFEAMSAIEMMDPKMDAGMISTGHKNVITLDTGIEKGYIKIENLSNEEIVGIIDESYARLVTWFDGHYLAQTVYTNLYLHKPSRIVDKTLRSFCIAFNKIVELARLMIGRASIYEEEDFQPQVFGLCIENFHSDGNPLALIRETEDILFRRVRPHLKFHPPNKKDTNTSFESDLLDEMVLNQDSTTTGIRSCIALHSRLKGTRLFLQLLTTLNKLVHFSPNDGESERFNDQPSIINMEKCIHNYSETLLHWESTIDVGISPDASPMCKNVAPESVFYTIMGFEPLANQRLLPPTFPRPTHIRSRQEMIASLTKLAQNLKETVKVVDKVTFLEVMDFFDHFSRQPSSCVLSRSYLYLTYMPTPGFVFGAQAFCDIIRDSIKYFVRPPILQSKFISSISNSKNIISQSQTWSKAVDSFLDRSTRPFLSLIQLSGHNRARQRERMASCLEELSTLQEEAETLDSYLNSSISRLSDINISHVGYFSTYVLYHILRLSIGFVLSGFELELYSSHEYLYVYWYLYEFLYSWIVSTLSRASSQILDYEASPYSSSANATSMSEKGKNHKKNKLSKNRRKWKPHHHKILIAQAAQCLSGGLFKTLCGLKVEKRLRIPCSPLHTAEKCYTKRFAPLGVVVAPPLVPYSQFIETSERVETLQANELYSGAARCFQDAKDIIETIQDPSHEDQAFLKVAKMNGVVVKLLLSGHKRDSKEFPQFDFTVHHHFPIIRIM